MRTSPKLALIGIVSTLGFLGLAILGSGGFGAFFSHWPLTVVAVATLLMAIAAAFTEANLCPGEAEDRSNRWVLAAFAVLGLLAAWLPAYSDRAQFCTLDGETIRWVGVVLYGLGGILRLGPVFVLGRRFSGLAAIQAGHRLETRGVYGVIRHPSYLGMLVIAFGWALAFRSGLGILLAVLTVIPVVARIRAEEGLMATHFGTDYADYRQRTWRLVPGLY